MFTINVAPPPVLTYSDDPTPALATHRVHPDVAFDEDAMDVDDLGEGSSSGIKSMLTSPGEVITSTKDYMRGHGTYVEDEQVIASVTGTIERVNKLVSVKALKSRYIPEVGDLVIGRIAEVGQLRWKVEANARQDAVLLLSSVNLPGGVQRRKMESDALKMREFLAEGDLLVAEVQAMYADGAMSLHTRSLKYGKLRNGLLLSLPPRLIRRLKSHFYTLPPPCGPAGVDVILGLNGYVWVAAGVKQEHREGGEGFDAEGVYSDKNDDIPPESRHAISLVANIITVLAREGIPITDVALLEGYAWATEKGVGTGELLKKEIGEDMVREVIGV